MNNLQPCLVDRPIERLDRPQPRFADRCGSKCQYEDAKLNDQRISGKAIRVDFLPVHSAIF